MEHFLRMKREQLKSNITPMIYTPPEKIYRVSLCGDKRLAGGKPFVFILFECFL
jgi:hypothetical protein